MTGEKRYVSVDSLKVGGAPHVYGIAVNVPPEKLLTVAEAQELVDEIWDAIKDLQRVQKAMEKVRVADGR